MGFILSTCLLVHLSVHPACHVHPRGSEFILMVIGAPILLSGAQSNITIHWITSMTWKYHPNVKTNFWRSSYDYIKMYLTIRQALGIGMDRKYTSMAWYFETNGLYPCEMKNYLSTGSIKLQFYTTPKLWLINVGKWYISGLNSHIKGTAVASSVNTMHTSWSGPSI